MANDCDSRYSTANLDRGGAIVLACVAISILFAIIACSPNYPIDDVDITPATAEANPDNAGGPDADAKPGEIGEALRLRTLPAGVDQPDKISSPPEIKHPPGSIASMSSKEKDLWKRQHLYSQATSMRSSIQRQRESLMRQREMGNDPEPFEKQLAFSLNLQQEMLQSLETAHSMSRAELAALIAHGDAEGWPQGVADR